MRMCSLKLLQMRFGMPYVGGRGNFKFDFFFPFLKDYRAFLLSSGWLHVAITSGSPSWPYKQHDVLINCTSSSLWDTCQYAVCIVVMSHPLVILTLCLMLWLQWILRNFSELFLEAGNMILFNYKLNVISPNDSVRDPPLQKLSEVIDSFPGSDRHPFYLKTCLSDQPWKSSWLLTKSRTSAWGSYSHPSSKRDQQVFTALSFALSCMCPSYSQMELLTMVPAIKMFFLHHLFLELVYLYFIANIKWHLLLRTLHVCT